MKKWTVKKSESGLIFILDEKGNAICNVNEEHPEAERIAELIASAPEMADRISGQ